MSHLSDDGYAIFESDSLILPPPQPQSPPDAFHFAYAIYFTLGVGFLLPWNAFITAVDYFSHVYPHIAIDRIFAVVYMLVALFCLIVIIFYCHRSDSFVRVNIGLGLFTAGLLIVPIVDAAYVKGHPGLYVGFYVVVGAVAVIGLADALVQGGLIGAAGELPVRYMQAIVAGTAGSGVLVSSLRIATKAAYAHDPNGLRKSANLYFAVSIVVMILCFVFFNIAHRLPVIQYYTKLKSMAQKRQNGDASSITRTLPAILKTIKWHGIGIILVYTVTLAIFPGYITEETRSETLKDWYSILLITGFNVFDLIGKSLPAVYLTQNLKLLMGGCFVRLLFFPLFSGCIHGPEILRSEIPVTVLTCLLGLTNGYLLSVLMILSSKAVQIQEAETAGGVIVVFSFVGLSAGSVLAWVMI